MKLKTVEVDGKTFAEIKDGKPVYVDDSGEEVAFDVEGTAATIKRLNAEAKGHREAKEAALEKLKAYDGLDDPAAAMKALETVSNLDKKKLIDAGEVEKLKAEMAKSFEASVTAERERAEKAEKALNQELIGGSFSRSSFIRDKVAVPADFVEAKFRDRFQVKDGKLIATDPNGGTIYSKSNPGEPAGFDEALSVLIEGYPNKDHILKGTGNSGTAKHPGNGAPNGSKTIARAEFDAMDQGTRLAKVKDGFTVVDQ